MTIKRPHTIHPVEKASQLEGAFRKLFHQPRRILKKYIREGMTVIDFGCGPGFFTLELANLVGDKGKIIAVDVQQGMLDIVQRKIVGRAFEKRVQLYKCTSDSVGLHEKADFILLFYSIHEVLQKTSVLLELTSLLKPGGRMLIAEQKGHVPKSEFRAITNIAMEVGLHIVQRPKFFFSRAVLLKRT